MRKLKFNWGTGIVLFLLLFIGSIVWRINIAYQQKVNLVSPDYYPKGVAYDLQLEKIKNTRQLKDKIELSQNDRFVILQFPEIFKRERTDGTILVYHPADFEDDSLFSIQLNDSSFQFIPKHFMKRGAYTFKFDWEQDNKAYFQETDLFIKK